MGYIGVCLLFTKPPQIFLEKLPTKFLSTISVSYLWLFQRQCYSKKLSIKRVKTIKIAWIACYSVSAIFNKGNLLLLASIKALRGLKPC